MSDDCDIPPKVSVMGHKQVYFDQFECFVIQTLYYNTIYY